MQVPSFFDMAKIDTKNFECLKFEDNSVYFGETAFLDEKGNICKAGEKGVKKKRHGKGVQMFLRPDNSILCKYEGEWHNGSKTGEGVSTYPDGSVYVGTMVSEAKQGFGKFIWPNRDQYSGNWHDDRMNGIGRFDHHEGRTFEGEFKNNYFYQGGKMAVSPFQSIAEIDEYVENQAEIQRMKEERKKEEKRTVEVVKSKPHLLDLIEKSHKLSMVPFVLSSKEKYLTLAEFVTEMKEKYNDIFVFDLRKASHEPKPINHSHVIHGSSPKAGQQPDLSPYFKFTKNTLARMMTNGGMFIISLDEPEAEVSSSPHPKNDHSNAQQSDQTTPALPAIKSLFNPSFLPSSILNLTELSNPSVFSRVLLGTQYNSISPALSPSFRICVWGKYKLEHTHRKEEIVTKIHRKYSQAQGQGEGIDLTGIDIIVWDLK